MAREGERQLAARGKECRDGSRGKTVKLRSRQKLPIKSLGEPGVLLAVDVLAHQRSHGARLLRQGRPMTTQVGDNNSGCDASAT